MAPQDTGRLQPRVFCLILLIVSLLAAGCSRKEKQQARSAGPDAGPAIKPSCVAACRHVFALPVLERRTDLDPTARRQAADRLLDRATRLIEHCARTCSAKWPPKAIRCVIDARTTRALAACQGAAGL